MNLVVYKAIATQVASQHVLLGNNRKEIMNYPGMGWKVEWNDAMLGISGLGFPSWEFSLFMIRSGMFSLLWSSFNYRILNCFASQAGKAWVVPGIALFLA